MNPKFLELPEEKREKIVNAGFLVFGRSDYRHASTEEIACQAGISKGLLFYYFKNKRSFYAYLFEQAMERVKAYVLDGEIAAITDFFDCCQYCARRKYELLSRTPHIMDFLLRAYYSKDKAVSEKMGRQIREETAQLSQNYFGHLDFSKFRDDVDFKTIYRMLVWMAEGYIVDRGRTGEPVDLDEMMDRYMEIVSYLKRLAYKEEYLK